MKVYTPSEARKNFYSLIKQVSGEHEPIEINNSRTDESVIVISKDDWSAIEETLYLQNAGVLDQIKDRKDEGYESLGVIDWDTL